MSAESDKSLLEAAARAAGIDGVYFDVLENKSMPLATGNGPWNPLTDDGDAFRLAVKLRFEFFYGFNHHRDSEAVTVSSGDDFVSVQELIDDADPTIATRRAIVRAAAALDKDTHDDK